MRHDEKIKTAFGQVIYKRRSKLGLTQEQLADLCGSARNYIGELERAEKQPTLVMFFSIAEALDVTPIELLKDVMKELMT